MCILENVWFQSILTGLISGIVSSIIVTCWYRAKDNKVEAARLILDLKYFSLRLNTAYEKVKECNDEQFFLEMNEWISMNPMPADYSGKLIRGKEHKQILMKFTKEFTDAWYAVMDNDRERAEKALVTILLDRDITKL